jgi:TM2 domain-containing membrane protein YozV
MNKHYLQSKVKSTGTAYLFWFLLGAHYAYLGKWGIQILYWITLGGLGIWALIDLFTMSGKVNKYNAEIFQQIEAIEKKDKDDDHARNMAMMTAASGKTNTDN